MAKQQFIDDIIEHKEDDLEKIQASPNMYISYTGERGSLHLGKESVNNAIDECINPNSPADKVDIYLDEATGELIVKDNGRGIPFDKLELVCSKIQSSSKFGRKGASKNSAGQNGVGMTACNALAEKFEITSIRDGKIKTILFNDGKKISDITADYKNKKEHGTIVKFIPSKKFMGKKCSIDYKMLLEWLDKISFIIPANITLTCSVERIGKSSSVHKTWCGKIGLDKYLKKYDETIMFEPIHIKDYINVISDEAPGEEKFLGVELAFSLTPQELPFNDSFCNFVNTIDGGVHLNACKDAIAYYLQKEVKENLSDKDKKKLEIKTYDILSALSIAVYVYTDLSPHFTGQTKEKVSNMELERPLKDMVTVGLKRYLKNNPKLVKGITSFIKDIAKARFEAQKIRNSVVKGKQDNLSRHRIKGFTEANNSKGKEIYLTEGGSAGGGAVEARNPQTQAVYCMRGVPKNTYKVSLAKALENEEIKNLVTVLGCNIGPKFNIDNLLYDKIILMTDADVDGYNITSMMASFFVKYMPEVVERGHLYKSVPPLYKLVEGTFVGSKKDFISLMEQRISKSVNIYKLNGDKLSRKEVLELLLRNRLYLELLNITASHFTMNPLFLEFIIRHDGSPKFDKLLKKSYPEIEILEDGTFIRGVVDGQLQSVIKDKMYFKRINELKDMIFETNNGEIYYRIEEIDKRNGNDDRGICSMGAMMKLFQKFKPVIKTRFKGLGELNPKDLWETTMDPMNRNLIRLTMNDLKREMEKFDILHGDNSLNKEMMEHFKINREDLDN